MSRSFDRTPADLRPVELITNVNKHAEGSCMAKFGDTHVLCTASIDARVPGWLRGGGKGWVTAEYGMLPRSTNERMNREAKRGQGGRTQEIQRLIGRALRAVCDFKAMGETCIRIDCDVIQADGGTRTAAITGGYVALYQAVKKLEADGAFSSFPIVGQVAAISCGIVGGMPLLDLDYEEDSNADADANFVMTGKGDIVEIQGTAEGAPFSRTAFNGLIDLAEKGISELIVAQRNALDI